MKCPSDEKIAQFCTGALPQQEKELTSQHFMSCEKCLKAISVIIKAERPGKELPESIRLKISKLSAPTRLKLILLPAACSLIAFLSVILIRSTFVPFSEEQPLLQSVEFQLPKDLVFVSSVSDGAKSAKIGGERASPLQPVYPGQTIEGTLNLSFSNGSEFFLKESLLEMINWKKWRLKSGEIWARIARGIEGEKKEVVSIETENGVINVNMDPTEITLSCNSDKTDIGVIHGNAVVKAESSEQVLNKGMSARLEKKTPPKILPEKPAQRPAWIRRLLELVLDPKTRSEYWHVSYLNSKKEDWNIELIDDKTKIRCKKDDKCRIQAFGKTPIPLDEPINFEFKITWPQEEMERRGAFIIRHPILGELWLAFRKHSVHLYATVKCGEPRQLCKFKLNREGQTIKLRIEKDKISLWNDGKEEYAGITHIEDLDKVLLGFIFVSSLEELIIEDLNIYRDQEYEEMNMKKEKQKLGRWLKRLKKLDKNNDGIISKDEWPPNKQARILEKIDKNNDGIISKDEIEKFVQERKKEILEHLKD